MCDYNKPLADHSNLTTLSFRRNNSVTVKGICALSGLVNLLKLDLERCPGIHGGLVHIKGLSKLESLNISCCNCITDADMKPLSAISMTQTKIVDFVPIQRCSQPTEKLCNDSRKKRKCTTSLGVSKKKRKLLPFSPSEDSSTRFKQMQSLAEVLTATGAEYSNELTYIPGMAPRSANCPTLEREGMQVMSKEDSDTINLCKSMMERGEWPPLMVVFDPI